MEKPLLSLQAVGKTFYTEKIQTNALADIHLNIFEGEFVAIEGPSGCGKSTLLSILGLLDAPTAGRYFIHQMPMQELGHAELARVRNAEIGFVFQDFNLIGDMTVFENVELPLTHRNLSRKDRKQRVMECLEVVGMTARADHYPSQLSGGQQQRVAVARSVVGNPAVLLADEPTGNLDSANGDAVMKLLSDLNQKQKVTICMVTHDSRYTSAAGRRVQLFDGKIVADEGQRA
jgi:putative ABC transport system ATP-binding protein